MAVLEALTEEEMYLVAILQDMSGVDIAEFLWKDPDQPDNLFRCWPYQYPWYRNDSKKQIDQCVAAGELVLTRRGHVPIEDVVVGDEVWTHANRWRPVTYTWDRGEREVFRLSNPGNAAGLRLTRDHKVWARSAKRRMRNGVRYFDLTDPSFVELQEFQPRRGEIKATLVASPYNFGERSKFPLVELLPNCSNHTLPTSYGEEFFWLCGIYVSEGSIHRSSTTVLDTYLSVNDKEVSDVVAHAQGCGLSPRTSKSSIPNVTTVVIPGKSLAVWWMEQFGHLATGKKLPTWVFSLPVPYRAALLRGLIYGDGHERATRRDPDRLVSEYTTSSRALAYDVRLLAQSLGHGSNVSCSTLGGPEVILGRQVTRRPSYSVSVWVEKSKRSRLVAVDNHLWTAFYDIVPDGTARVYDLEVADDHSFVVNGQVVSNCARAIGKSVGIQMRGFAFCFTNPGQEMLITAPELIHLDPVTRNIEDRLMSTRLSREMLKSAGISNGIKHRPFEASFRNGAKIIGRIPQKDGKGVKGMHPRWLEMDEAQDYPAAGWIELVETLRYGDETSRWRAHGVSRGVRDHYYKLSQSDDWFVHRITAMHRPDWTASERVAKAELYGSRDHPDYRRNILGLHGDAMSALFVLHRLMACVDSNTESAYNQDIYYHFRMNDETLRDSGMSIEQHIQFPGIHKQMTKTFWCGMDVGLTNHPTEILIFAEETVNVGGGAAKQRLTVVGRLHLERISSPDQLKVLEAICDFYKPQALAMDRTGLGLPIYQYAINPHQASPWLNRAIRGYNFSEKIPVAFEELENPDEWVDPMDRAIFGNVLEYSSDQLRLLVDQGRLKMPWDVDMLREFQGQAYYITKSSTNPYGKKEFNKGKFHALDAARMGVLGYIQHDIEKQVKIVQEHDPIMLTWLNDDDGGLDMGWAEGF